MENNNKKINFTETPEIKIDTKKIFGVECTFEVKGFDKKK